MRQKPQEARAGDVISREGESINMFQEVKLPVYREWSSLTNITAGQWPPEEIS